MGHRGLPQRALNRNTSQLVRARRSLILGRLSATFDKDPEIFDYKSGRGDAPSWHPRRPSHRAESRNSPHTNLACNSTTFAADALAQLVRKRLSHQRWGACMRRRGVCMKFLVHACSCQGWQACGTGTCKYVAKGFPPHRREECACRGRVRQACDYNKRLTRT